MAFPRLHAKTKKIAVADILTTVTAPNTLVPADHSKRYKIVDVAVRAIGGNAAGSTTLQVTNGVEVAWSITTTDLDENVIKLPESTNVTATHLGHWGLGNKPIGLIRTGTVTTTATHVEATVYYLVEGCN